MIQAYSFDSPEISVKQLVEILRRGRILLISIPIAFAALSAVASWLAPTQYVASVVTSPVSQSDNPSLGGLGGIASQFGGLASLAGISLSQDGKKWESLGVLESHALTEKYISDNKLIPTILGDPASSFFTTPPPPTLWRATERFRDHIREITTDNKTGLVTITVTWNDPNTAAKWANDLVSAANTYLRNQAVEQSERNIAYLTDQASKTDVVGIRQAIYSLLQSEISKVMLAKGNTDYAFKVLDPATPPEEPSSPKPVLWTVLGMLFGIVIAMFILVIRSHRQIAQSNTELH